MYLQLIAFSWTEALTMKCFQILAIFGVLCRLTKTEDEGSMALRFLNEYDYLSTSRSGNHDVESAIKDFQRFAGLEVTCEIDQPTIRLLKTPRCGNPDDVAVRESSNSLLQYR